MRLKPVDHGGSENGCFTADALGLIGRQEEPMISGVRKLNSVGILDSSPSISPVVTSACKQRKCKQTLLPVTWLTGYLQLGRAFWRPCQPCTFFRQRSWLHSCPKYPIVSFEHHEERFCERNPKDTGCIVHRNGMLGKAEKIYQLYHC